ncbi:hypothetical protein PAPYR_1904 [Paratrimastix pyriformis]|uniref:FZ domain-containing protein n=1 Tax=Paratrimastix pyriformis TaxID=342808 RepID=A0ABQ8UTU3_9EUKA|nr:hypothetical protein PAPYR_1904 [Paratrimastix pyriformis]
MLLRFVGFVFGLFALSEAIFSTKCGGDCSLLTEFPLALENGNDPFSACRDYINYSFCASDVEKQNNLVGDAAVRYFRKTRSTACSHAFYRYFCGLAYPMCDRSNGTLGTTQVPVCKSTCEHFYSICEELDTEGLCDEFTGVGPSDSCTGAASGLKPTIAVLGLGLLSLGVILF